VYFGVGEMQLGSTRTGVPSQLFPAGKGLNVAKVVRALGEEVCVTGIMPDSNRAWFEKYCESRKIVPRFFSIEGHARVNATILEEEVGQVTHISATGPKMTTRVQEDLQRFVSEVMKPGDFWVFSGSIPTGFDNDAYSKLIRQCRQAKTTTLLDTSGAALKMGVRAKPDMVKPNLTELEGYFGEKVKGIRHIALKGKKLLDTGIKYVFISLGSDGLIAIHENDCLLCSTPAVKVVDTVGCGDALVAGLVVGERRHFSFPEMCRLAVACGSSNAMHPGPGNIVLEEVWQLMEEVTVETA